MAVLQAILAMIFRSFGRILNTAFGWANIMLFGKVSAKKQIYLSIMTFSSVIWLVVLIGIVFPSFATVLLAFVTLPTWMNPNTMRLAMFVSALVLPALVGLLSFKLVPAEEAPHGAKETARLVLSGYPYTLGLSLTLLYMLLVAPLLRIRNMLRRWTTVHVPLVVEPEDYLEVVAHIQAALRRGGIETTRTRASFLMRLPTKILSFFAGGTVDQLVAANLVRLVSEKGEIVLHPSDLVIAGREKDVGRARAILAEYLTYTKAYMTWDKEANDIEDRIRLLWCDVVSNGRGFHEKGVRDRFDFIEQALKKASLPYEEWEVVFRAKLIVERALLRQAAGIRDVLADEAARRTLIQDCPKEAA